MPRIDPLQEVERALLRVILEKGNQCVSQASLKTGNIYATNYVETLVREKGISLRQAKMQVEKMIKDGTYKE